MECMPLVIYTEEAIYYNVIHNYGHKHRVMWKLHSTFFVKSRLTIVNALVVVYFVSSWQAATEDNEFNS